MTKTIIDFLPLLFSLINGLKNVFGGNFMQVGLILFLASHLIIGLDLNIDLFIRVSREICTKYSVIVMCDMNRIIYQVCSGNFHLYEPLNSQ